MEAYVVRSDKLEKLLDSHGDGALIYNPRMVFGKEQALLAAKMAMMAFENGQNIAKKLPIEFLIRLSGEKQISKALSFGLGGIDDVAGIIILEECPKTHIEEVDVPPDMGAISEKYGAGDEDMVEKILEKMSLVDI